MRQDVVNGNIRASKALSQVLQKEKEEMENDCTDFSSSNFSCNVHSDHC